MQDDQQTGGPISLETDVPPRENMPPNCAKAQAGFRTRVPNRKVARETPDYADPTQDDMQALKPAEVPF